MTVFWAMLYAVSWVAHGFWFVPFKLLLEPRIKSFAVRGLMLFFFWVGVDVACNGCPFMYLHEWIEVQAGWKEKITYKYEDSIAYQYVIAPLFGHDDHDQ